MASKLEKKKAIMLEAREILRGFRKVPQSSNSLVEKVDSLPPGNLSVDPMSEDGRDALIPDGGAILVKEPEICSGSLWMRAI